MFTLVVNDFSVKCKGVQHAKHLKEALEIFHELSINCKGKCFCVLTLYWNYNDPMRRHIYLSMNGYINKALNKYQHPFPTQPQHPP